MGTSHARAYHEIDQTKIVGLVSRKDSSWKKLNDVLGSDYPGYTDYHLALKETSPDIVCICTYTDTHAEFAIAAMEAGAHVFLEKPLAANMEDARRVIETAEKLDRKLILGYILRVHPSWIKFIELARTLGSPTVMRLNLNQQSSGEEWRIHKNLMKSTSPLVDCGVHYVDVMCQVCDTRPVSVFAIGARLTDEIAEDMYNYGQLQVKFEDGSVGWYEAGWGPMMSTTAYFVKDIVGPGGSVSIADKSEDDSSTIDSHTTTDRIKYHRWSKQDGRDIIKDEWVTTEGEPGHDELCKLEQLSLLNSIKEDIDLEEHWQAALDSLEVVLAADESIRTGKVIRVTR